MTIDSNGNLFGTTEAGGATGFGTVFEIALGSTIITTLASFNGFNGVNPYAGLTLDASGNLFGTTELGGTNNAGTVFEIVHGATSITSVASFNGLNGADPYSGVTLDAAGNIFGTATSGGTGNAGAVFEIAHGVTSITSIASFNGVNGANPFAGIALDASGNIFGAAHNSGAFNDGTIFEIVHGTTAITPLASFNGGNGLGPYGGVTLDSSGNLFGTTEAGGVSNVGTAFEIVRGSTAITTLVSFNPTTNGSDPRSGLTLDSNGGLFGSTLTGGAFNAGMIFEVAMPILSFTASPASALAGGVIGGSAGIQVSVAYSWGNVITTDSSTITVTLGNGVFTQGGNFRSARQSTASPHSIISPSTPSEPIRSPPQTASSPLPCQARSTSIALLQSRCRPSWNESSFSRDNRFQRQLIWYHIHRGRQQCRHGLRDRSWNRRRHHDRILQHDQRLQSPGRSDLRFERQPVRRNIQRRHFHSTTARFSRSCMEPPPSPRSHRLTEPTD